MFLATHPGLTVFHSGTLPTQICSWHRHCCILAVNHYKLAITLHNKPHMFNMQGFIISGSREKCEWKQRESDDLTSAASLTCICMSIWGKAYLCFPVVKNTYSSKFSHVPGGHPIREKNRGRRRLIKCLAQDYMPFYWWVPMFHYVCAMKLDVLFKHQFWDLILHQNRHMLMVFLKNRGCNVCLAHVAFRIIAYIFMFVWA